MQDIFTLSTMYKHFTKHTADNGKTQGGEATARNRRAGGVVSRCDAVPCAFGYPPRKPGISPYRGF